MATPSITNHTPMTPVAMDSPGNRRLLIGRFDASMGCSPRRAHRVQPGCRSPSSPSRSCSNATRTSLSAPSAAANNLRYISVHSASFSSPERTVGARSPTAVAALAAPRRRVLDDRHHERKIDRSSLTVADRRGRVLIVSYESVQRQRAQRHNYVVVRCTGTLAQPQVVL